MEYNVISLVLSEGEQHFKRILTLEAVELAKFDILSAKEAERAKRDIITPANDEMTQHPAYKTLDGIEVDGYRVTVTDAEGGRASLMLKEQTTRHRNEIHVDVLVAVERQFAVPAIVEDIKKELKESAIKFFGNAAGQGPHVAVTIDYSRV